MSIANHKDFDKLMDTVHVLRSHYSTIATKVEREKLKAQIRGQTDKAAEYGKLLKKMQSDHDKALDLIGDKLTTPEQLQATRRELRSAADTAHKFIQSIKKATLTVKKVTEAAGFLTTLVTDLRKILN